jgi:hypothetical protein
VTLALHVSCSDVEACPAMNTWPMLQEHPPGAFIGAGKYGIGSVVIGQFCRAKMTSCW